MSSERDELVEQVLSSNRAMSTANVMFHTAIAATVGLSAVDTKATDYLARHGPMTPKRLAEYSGLRPASVTALIDRLEHKEFVRRTPHPDDGRSVLIELRWERMADGARLWDDLVAGMKELCQRYSADQLRTIIDFVAAATEITHDATAKLSDDAG